MAKQTIDGLVRSNPKKRRAAKAPAKKGAAEHRHKLEIKEATAANLKEKKTSKKLGAAELRDDSLIKDYLREIQDANPNDLDFENREALEFEEGLQPRHRRDVEDRKKKGKGKKGTKGKHRKRKVALGILIVLLIIGGVVYFLGDSLIRKITADKGNLIDFVVSSADKDLKKDKNERTNILIFGTEGYKMDSKEHPGAQLTDSMMVLSLNQYTGDIKAVSLPRDFYLKTCGANKLNEVYNCAYSKKPNAAATSEYEIKGAAALSESIEEITGLQIQYYIHVNWAALIDLVNAIGGIDVVFTYGENSHWTGKETQIPVTSARGLADWDRSKRRYSINYKINTPYHLMGVQALQVARVRNAYGGWGAGNGNFSREVFQQKIIQATVKKMRETNYITNWGAIIKIKDALGDNIRTSIDDSEIKSFMRVSNKVNVKKMQSLSLMRDEEAGVDILTTGMIRGISYVYPSAGRSDYSELQEYLEEKLVAEQCPAGKTKPKHIIKCIQEVKPQIKTNKPSKLNSKFDSPLKR